MFLVYHVISKNHVTKGSFDFMGSQGKLSSSPISWPKALRKYNGFHLSRDIMVFVCHVTLQDHVIKVFNDLTVRSPSRYVTIIPSLVAIDTVAVEIQLLQFVTLPEKILHVSGNGTFLYFRKQIPLKKHISGSNFLSSKKKNSLLKHLLYFGKWNFLAPGLKHFSYFWGELAKPENQTRSYSLELPAYYCTHSSLAQL